MHLSEFLQHVRDLKDELPAIFEREVAKSLSGRAAEHIPLTLFIGKGEGIKTPDYVIVARSGSWDVISLFQIPSGQPENSFTLPSGKQYCGTVEGIFQLVREEIRNNFQLLLQHYYCTEGIGHLILDENTNEYQLESELVKEGELKSVRLIAPIKAAEKITRYRMLSAERSRLLAELVKVNSEIKGLIGPTERLIVESIIGITA